MARKISFTRAERDAVEGAANLDCTTDSMKASHRKALDSLLAKMDAASAEPESTPLTGGPGGAAALFCEILKGRIVEPQTRPSWAMLAKALREAEWTEAEMRALDLSWATRPIPAATVALKGKDWLARQRPAAFSAKSNRPADMFFDTYHGDGDEDPE